MRRLLFAVLFYLIAPFLFAQSYLPRASVSLIKGVSNKAIPAVETNIARNLLSGVRRNTPVSPSLITRARKGIVQISRPHWEHGQLSHSSSVYASGFLLRYKKKLYIASAYHVMGGKGSQRVVRMPTKTGGEKEVLVEVEVNGRAGWHEPDISLAPISPEDIPEGMEPLTVAEPMLDQPAYSIGYMTGDFSLEDFLPVQRTFTDATENSLYGAYHIDGSSSSVPVTGNGQCGSPIFQYFPGQAEEWKVVGLHNGHLLDWNDPSKSLGSGVNLSKVLPALTADNLPARPLVFRGQSVTKLKPNERVAEISVIRYGEVVTTKQMKIFSHPYEDAHAEMALWNEKLVPGDMIKFTIILRQDVEPKRVKREVFSFVQ